MMKIEEAPVPRGAVLRCNEHGHRTDPAQQSPLRCQECGSINVLWENKRKPWLRVQVIKVSALLKGSRGPMGVDRRDWKSFAERFAPSIWTRMTA